MRYFVQIAYNGTRHSGWQIQPNAPSIQQKLADGLSTILRAEIAIVGCGRTDAGVHATDFYFHFDSDVDLPKDFLRRLNFLVGADIAIYHVWQMVETAHTRFDALKRSYVYDISIQKNPLSQEYQWYYAKAGQLNLKKMQDASALFCRFNDFFPFCKTHGDNKDFRCQITECTWTVVGGILRFEVTANRFLRGMIRLMVGACIAVGEEKLAVSAVASCLEQQERLPKPYSVPATGLRLSKIEYPEQLFVKQLY